MKKISLVIISLIILILSFFVIRMISPETDGVTIYAIDGSSMSVPRGDVEQYSSSGWYTEPVTEVYAADGRSMIIYTKDLEAYKNVGWYEQPVRIVYAPDGRQLIIAVKETEAYEEVGWYVNPVMYVYNPNGESAVISFDEKEKYVADGWYAEPIMCVYARDGRCMVIPCASVEDYKNVGWYDNPDDISFVMVAPDGSEKCVFADYYTYYYTQGYRFKSNPEIDLTKPMVALTFDDGPSIYTSGIIDCLKSYGARATFFCVGQNSDRYPHIVKKAFESAMEIGNHTYNHPDLTKLDEAGIYNELKTTEDSIFNAIGINPSVMRPPYGSVDEKVISITGNAVVLWSIDTLDWETRNANATYDAVISKVKDGDIILMHDIYGQTAEAVNMIVPKLHEAGFQMVTVSELMKFKNAGISRGVILNN